MTFKLKENSHVFIKKNKKNKDYLVSVVIGKKHFNDWKRYCLESWKKYAKKNDLGILIIKKDLIEKKSDYWKTPTWQRLLVAEYIRVSSLNVKNICVLDSDIFINELAPNIFKFSNLNKISVVNFYKNLPYRKNDYTLRERIVYLRRLFLDKSYPLRSSITASPKEIFKNYKLSKNLNNYFCAGVMVYNSNKFSKFFKDSYIKYCDKKYKKIFKGVEVPINFEIMKDNKPFWLDYKFQTNWLFELADKYSFVYREKKNYKMLVKYCAEEIILNSYFLHFPGTLKDAGKAWQIKNFFKDKKLNILNKFFNSKNKKIRPRFKK